MGGQERERERKKGVGEDGGARQAISRIRRVVGFGSCGKCMISGGISDLGNHKVAQGLCRGGILFSDISQKKKASTLFGYSCTCCTCSLVWGRARDA